MLSETRYSWKDRMKGETTGRRRKIRKQQLDDLKKKRRY